MHSISLNIYSNKQTRRSCSSIFRHSNHQALATVQSVVWTCRYSLPPFPRLGITVLLCHFSHLNSPCHHCNKFVCYFRPCNAFWFFQFKKCLFKTNWGCNSSIKRLGWLRFEGVAPLSNCRQVVSFSGCHIPNMYKFVYGSPVSRV